MRDSYMLKTAAPEPSLRSPSGPSIVVRRFAALGDALAASVVADKLYDLGYSVIWESHPSTHCIMRRVESISEVREPQGNSCRVNLDNAYEKDPRRQRMTFSQFYMESANAQLASLGINLGPAFNCNPRLHLDPQELHAAQLKFKQYPKPWVFVCPRSDAWKNRTVNDGTWGESAARINGTKFWMGRHCPAPPNFVDLKLDHVDNLIVWLSVADLLVTVDTGPMHIGAALGIPILALCQASSPDLHLSDQTDFMSIGVAGLTCLNCQKNICPISGMEETPPCQNFDPERIAYWANKKLGAIYGEDVSAIIPVYGPDPNVFQRCLDCVSPQVQEVIVTAETQDKLPPNIPQNGKVRAVVKGVSKVGFGRNVNFGVRHSVGKYLMIINDDVFLDPGCVDLLKAQMKPGVGCVSARLMYPENTVYFCGKVRRPGERGWGHLNHRQAHWDLKEPTQFENGFCAASLVSREAFYDSGCFDERLFCYCDDDAFSLQLGQHGWKIIVEPRASGIHLEGQSTAKVTGNRMDIVQQANKTFGEIWGWWFDKNLHTVPGVFE